jgi:hypothetical protein
MKRIKHRSGRSTGRDGHRGVPRRASRAAPTDAISLLRQDHRKVKALFTRFENAKGVEEKRHIAEEAINELRVHADIEEGYFYPVLRRELRGSPEILVEADEEHHVAKLLIGELSLMTGYEEEFDAKFTVLAENVRHHIKEEEDEMFPRAAKCDVDFEELGRRMLQRKQQVSDRGVPPDPEMLMMTAAGLRKASPAKRAAESVVVPKIDRPRRRT